MGPFELLDEIGLDIAAHVLRELGRDWHQPAARHGGSRAGD